MGSVVEISVIGARHGAEARARRAIEERERAWSRFRPDSELVSLNECAGSGPVRASELLRTAVVASVRLWRATDGWFDPTTLAALEECGYDRSFPTIEQRDGLLGSGSPAPGPVGVVVDDERGTIDLPEGVRIDLGGVGKGLAADAVAAALVDDGAAAACVSVGGDVAMAGTHPDGAWEIPVCDPAHGDRIGWRIHLAEGALVQSNRTTRMWKRGGSPMHHLIDPRTGRPGSTDVLAAVVTAEHAWWAEGVAKAAVLAGTRAGTDLVRRLALGGLLIREDGSVVAIGSLANRWAA